MGESDQHIPADACSHAPYDRQLYTYLRYISDSRLLVCNPSAACYTTVLRRLEELCACLQLQCGTYTMQHMHFSKLLACTYAQPADSSTRRLAVAATKPQAD